MGKILNCGMALISIHFYILLESYIPRLQDEVIFILLSIIVFAQQLSSSVGKKLYAPLVSFQNFNAM